MHEEGTHDGLMQRKGAYYELVTAQITPETDLTALENNGEK